MIYISAERLTNIQNLDRAVSDTQRNQIMGHRKAITFQKWYLSSRIVVDTQAAFLGQEPMSDLIKEMGKMALRRDPNLPKGLTEAQKEEAHLAEDLVQARIECNELRCQLKHAYRYINQAPNECPMLQRYRELKKKINTLKQRYEREAFDDILADFHSNADLESMIAQLKGEPLTSTVGLPAIQHGMPQRNELARSLFKPIEDDDAWSRVVTVMSELCLLFEGGPCQVVSSTADRSLDAASRVNGSMLDVISVTTELLTNANEYAAAGSKKAITVVSKPATEPQLRDPISSSAHNADSTDTPMPDISSVAAEPLLHQNKSPKKCSAKPTGSTSKRVMKLDLQICVDPPARQRKPILQEGPRGLSTGPKPRGPRRRPYTCLFCVESNAKGRFAHAHHLRRHYRTKHFAYQTGSFYCPVPECNMLIDDPDRFASHAASTHKAAIGVGASIMNTSTRQAKPGQLATFTL